MSQTHDFPFGIMDVVELLHLRIRRPSPKGVYVDCPICNDKRGKMHVNSQNDTWRCNYCDESGGMLSLYAIIPVLSAVQLSITMLTPSWVTRTLQTTQAAQRP